MKNLSVRNAIHASVGLLFVLAAAVPVQAQEPAKPLPAATLHGLPPAGAAKFSEIPATPELIRKLQGGGYTLYLRHGPTDNTKADRVPAVDMDDCNTQRPLTEEGRALMTKVGEHIRRAKIPFAELRVSPLCRAKDSAAAAFPKFKATIDNNLMYVANFTDAQKAPIIANTRQLLSSPVVANNNRLVLAHAPNLMDLIGYFPKEGTLVVFLPKGKDGFEYVASIPPALWSALLP
jgi:phosphohistidine phosphatase SixA